MPWSRYTCSGIAPTVKGSECNSHKKIIKIQEEIGWHADSLVDLFGEHSWALEAWDCSQFIMGGNRQRAFQKARSWMFPRDRSLINLGKTMLLSHLRLSKARPFRLCLRWPHHLLRRPINRRIWRRTCHRCRSQMMLRRLHLQAKRRISRLMSAYHSPKWASCRPHFQIQIFGRQRRGSSKMTSSKMVQSNRSRRMINQCHPRRR